MPNVFDEVEAESKRNVFDEVLEETPPPVARPGYGLVTATETPRVPMTTIAPSVAIPWPTEKPDVTIPASPTESFIRPAFEGIKAESKPEQGPITGVAKGLWNVGVGIPEFATSSLGMGSLVVAPLAPRITSGLFTLDIIRNLVKQAPELAKQWDSLSVGQKTQAGTELLAQIGLAMGLGIKTVQGWGRQPLGRASETQRQAVQFTQELAQKDPAKFGQMAQDAIKKAAEIEQREPGPTAPLPLVPEEERKEPVAPEAVPPPTAAAQAVVAAGQAPAAAAAPIPEARALPAQAAVEASARAAAIQKPAWVINLEAVEKAGNLNQAQAQRLAKWRAENEPVVTTAETKGVENAPQERQVQESVLGERERTEAQRIPPETSPSDSLQPAAPVGEAPPETLPNAPAREPVLAEPPPKESLTVEPPRRKNYIEMQREREQALQKRAEEVAKEEADLQAKMESDAKPVVDALKEVSGQKHPQSGIATDRGGNIWDEVVDQKFTQEQLNAARRWLIQNGHTDTRLLRAIEGARPKPIEQPPSKTAVGKGEVPAFKTEEEFRNEIRGKPYLAASVFTRGKAIVQSAKEAASRLIERAKTGKPFTPEEIHAIADDLGFTIGTEKAYLMGKSAGEAGAGKASLRSRMMQKGKVKPEYVGTVIHEMGHELLHQKSGMKPWELEKGKPLVRGEWVEVQKMSSRDRLPWTSKRKYYTQQTERYARLFDLYMTRNAELKARAPTLYAKMESLIADSAPSIVRMREVYQPHYKTGESTESLAYKYEKKVAAEHPTPTPAAETGEKGPMRPGPGAATGGAVEDPIQTLNEQIAALPRSDARTRVSMAERIADRLAAGKDLAHRAALRAQAVTQSLAQTFRGVRTPTELGNRVGEVDYLLQKAAALSRENARVLERSIPDLATRQGLWIWADAHGNEAAIRDAILKLPRETKPAVRRALQASLKLTDKEKAWLPFVREYYDKKAQVAEQMGVLNSVLEDYYTHVWRVKDNMPAKLQAAFNSGKIKEYWQFNRERKLPDILTGIVDPTIVGRRRYVDPETGVETIVESGKRLEPILDPAKIIPHYNYTLDRAIASRAFMKAVSEMKTSTGEPALAPKGVAENRVFNQWAVVNDKTGRADPFVQGVFETEAEANAALAGRSGYHVEQRPNEYLFIKSHVTPEQIAKYKPIDHPSMRKWQWAGTDGNKTVLYEGELLAHPEVHERLARMMDRSRLTPSPLTRAVLRYSAETKAAKLGMLSSFHLIHVGKHAVFHLTNPFKAAMDSMRSLGGKGIDWESPEVRQAIEKGHLNLAADPGDVAAMSEGAGGAGKLIIHKFPLLGPLSKAFSEWMFQDFIPQLKFQTYRNALQRNLKMYGPQATPTGRVLARAGVLGLPVGRLTPDEVAARTGDAVNAAYGELNKLWLGAHGRNPATQRALRMIFLAPDFGEARLRFVGKAATAFGNEERLALIMNALMVYSAARVANMLISGNPHNDDARHLFDVKVGDHWLTMRSVLVDVEHAMTNFIQFSRIRMNPALVTPLLDLFTGTNWKGQKRNGWQWVKDRLAAYVPAQAQSLTEDNKHLWESWLASMGINPKRADAVAEIHERARRFRDQRGIVSPVDIAVSPEGNPYREARIALEFDDPWRFWRAMQQQVQRLDATNTKQPLKVIEGAFARYYAMPFSGKKSLEPDFVASLAPRDRTIYREAQQRQKETYAKFKDWWRDHKSYLGQ